VQDQDRSLPDYSESSAVYRRWLVQIKQ